MIDPLYRRQIITIEIANILNSKNAHIRSLKGLLIRVELFHLLQYSVDFYVTVLPLGRLDSHSRLHLGACRDRKVVLSCFLQCKLSLTSDVLTLPLINRTTHCLFIP